jgi:Bacterial Ig domain
MRKHLLLFCLLAVIILFSGVFLARAQDQPILKLNIARVFGYSSGIGSGRFDIQGTFGLKASGPEDLARVVFTIDGQTIGEATQAPFDLRFVTDSYPLGTHTMQAIGYTSAGDELKSNTIAANFVTAGEGWQAGLKIAIPMLAIVFGTILIGMVFTLFSARNQRKLPLGAPRKYGVSGGTICSNCGRPFALHFLALHFVGSKVDRCPFCGKWKLVKSIPLAELRAAEVDELARAQEGGQVPAEPELEKLQKELDDSRYQNS